METCQALTKRNYKCSRGGKYCINKNGEKTNYCKTHLVNHNNRDYYYDKEKGKLIVNRIRRTRHDKLTGLPTRYTRGLTPRQKLAYRKEIQETSSEYKKYGRVRGRAPVSNLKPKRSNHVVEFERKYGYKITDIDHVKHDFPDTNINMILKKGRAAYASGSRPTVTGSGGPTQWQNGRLASVLTGGKALAVDKDLVGPKSLKKIYSKNGRR